MEFDSLNHELIDSFVESLSANDPDCDDYQDGLEYFHRIENALCSQSQYDISQVYLSGSLAKETALHYKFDVDIIVFYNCKGGYGTYLDMRGDLLDEIEDIVVEEFQDETVDHIKSYQRSFQINVNGIHIDILTGLNRLQNKENDIGMQYNRILNIVHYKSDDEPTVASYEMQTSMAETADQFVLDQSDFVQNLIVLCKHWCQCYLADQVNFYGRSSVMELVAIYAGNCVEYEGDLNYSRAFYKFLEVWINGKNMTIEFPYTPKFKGHLIKRIKPYLLDPINPYNNRLRKITPDKFHSISKIAKQSMKWFVNCFKKPKNFDRFFKFSEHMGDDFDDYDIFED